MWYCEDEDVKGDLSIYIFDLSFYADGSAVISSEGSPYNSGLRSYLGNGGKLPVLQTRDGELLGAFEAYSAYLEAAGTMTDELRADFDKVTIDSITYELQNWTDFDEGEEDAFYKADENDMLVLHITGSYKKTPMETQKIDTVYHFEKELPVLYHSGYAEMYLMGDWQDSLGNAWSFGYALPEGKDEYSFSFSMKDSDGVDHISKGFYTDSEDDTVSELIYFSFEDFSTPRYKIVSADVNTLVLDDEGTELVLTRVSG